MSKSFLYVPYFRGKQFDLLGLKEAVNKDLIGENTIPLVEPVRDSKVMLQTIEAFIEKKKELIILKNAQVGQVPLGTEKLYPFEEYFDSSYIIPAYQITNDFNYELIAEKDFVFLSQDYAKETLEEIVAEYQPRFHMIVDNARLRKAVQHNRVFLSDPFTRLKHGADYLELPDEFYCDDYKFLEEDGYIGFSNYGIDGQAYYDKGYPSKSVVLHILYLDKYQTLRIKHFTSDSNEAASNPAGKFFEALDKLVAWYKKYEKEIPLTAGLKELMSCQETKKYPGAGTTKKLLVIHQMELMKILTAK